MGHFNIEVFSEGRFIHYLWDCFVWRTGIRRNRQVMATSEVTPRYQSSVVTNAAPAKKRAANTMTKIRENGLCQSKFFPRWTPTSLFDPPGLVTRIGLL